MLIDEMTHVLKVAREAVQEGEDLTVHSVIRTSGNIYIEGYVPDDDAVGPDAKQALKKAIKKKLRRFSRSHKVYSIIIFSRGWLAPIEANSLPSQHPRRTEVISVAGADHKDRWLITQEIHRNNGAVTFGEVCEDVMTGETWFEGCRFVNAEPIVIQPTDIKGESK